MIMYITTQNTVKLGTERFRTFGICAFDTVLNKTVAEFCDVSTEKQQVARLVKLCNDSMLDPVHLINVIEDYLSSPQQM